MTCSGSALVGLVGVAAACTAVIPARAAPVDDDNGTLAETMRVETIGYRLASANVDACPTPVMRTGLVLHDLAAYAPDQRTRVGHDYDLTYGFGILGIVPGSTGALAGLRAGDEIVALNGQTLADYQTTRFSAKATFARTGAFIDLLAGRLAQAPVTMAVRRGSGLLWLRLGGLPGCGGYVSAIKSGAFNAWSDGTGIAVTTRLIHFAADDNELAFVVAHEMAHNLLGHNAPLHNADAHYLSSLLAAFGIGSARIRRREIAADQFAVHLLAHTAYHPNAAVGLLTRLDRNLLMKLSVDFSHPTLHYRIALNKAAIAGVHACGAPAPAAGNGP